MPKTKADDFIQSIMDECAPGKMSKQEALDFIEEIGSAMDGSADALRAEIEDES